MLKSFCLFGMVFCGIVTTILLINLLVATNQLDQIVNITGATFGLLAMWINYQLFDSK